MKKKIIFFSRNLNIGGMEKALVILLNQLVQENVDVTLILEEKKGYLLSELDERICVQEYRLSKNMIPLLRKIMNLSHRIMWGITHYRKYDFSCNYATYSVMGSKLALIASDNSALYVHSDYYHYHCGNTKFIKTFFEQQGISKFRHVIFVAKEAMQPIARIYPQYVSKFTTISNLIEKEAVLSLSEEKVHFSKVADKELVVFVGRLEEQSKRLSRLIESFRYVLQKSKQFQFLIIGDGPSRKMCEQLIAEYRLRDDVTMLGELPNPYPYIRMADCVVLTSDFEGFPVIYNECLVLKTPLVTTIPTSDDFLDSREYSVIIEKRADAIGEAILSKAYRKVIFETVDVGNINKNRINKLKEIILRKERKIHE